MSTVECSGVDTSWLLWWSWAVVAQRGSCPLVMESSSRNSEDEYKQKRIWRCVQCPTPLMVTALDGLIAAYAIMHQWVPAVCSGVLLCAGMDAGATCRMWGVACCWCPRDSASCASVFRTSTWSCHFVAVYLFHAVYRAE